MVRYVRSIVYSALGPLACQANSFLKPVQQVNPMGFLSGLFIVCAAWVLLQTLKLNIVNLAGALCQIRF